jgi:hypothetical protein
MFKYNILTEADYFQLSRQKDDKGEVKTQNMIQNNFPRKEDLGYFLKYHFKIEKKNKRMKY